MRLLRLWVMLASILTAAWPAHAEIIKTDAALGGKNFCYLSGSDAEQYGRDHSYIYTFHTYGFFRFEYVIKGSWTIAKDGTVSIKMEGGGTLVRKYDVDGDHVVEMTGVLNGGADGRIC